MIRFAFYQDHFQKDYFNGYVEGNALDRSKISGKETDQDAVSAKCVRDQNDLE